MISLFALFTAFVIACSTEEPDATVTSQQDDSKMEGTVEIDGSSTVYPISEAVAEEFNKLYPKVRDAILAGEKVTIRYSNINLNEIVADAVTKLSNKSPQNMIGATDIYEKISEINGNLKTLEAKLEGKNII